MYPGGAKPFVTNELLVSLPQETSSSARYARTDFALLRKYYFNEFTELLSPMAVWLARVTIDRFIFRAYNSRTAVCAI